MVIDIITAILIAVGFYAGFSRGIIKTAFDTLSILLAILVTLKLSPVVMDLCEQVIPVSKAINIILGIVITFVVVMWLVRIVGKQLESLLKVIKINILNQLAGGAFMAVFYALCFSMILWLFNHGKLISDEQKEKSVSYELLEPLPEQGKTLFLKLKPVFTDFWNHIVEMTDDIKEKTDNMQIKTDE